jgi:hypothetical protein
MHLMRVMPFVYARDTSISNPLIARFQKNETEQLVFMFMASSIKICTTRIVYLAAALILVLGTMPTFPSCQAGGCMHRYLLTLHYSLFSN